MARILNISGAEIKDRGIQKLADYVEANLPDEFIVMPNHVHGIICIVGAPLVGALPLGLQKDIKYRVGARPKNRAGTRPKNRAGTRPAPTAIHPPTKKREAFIPLIFCLFRHLTDHAACSFSYCRLTH